MCDVRWRLGAKSNGFALPAEDKQARSAEGAESCSSEKRVGMNLQPGDILAFHGTDTLSRLIRVATWGPSHVGMIVFNEGQPVLIESTTMCKTPCLIRGKRTSGVQAQWPADRIANYNGRVDVYRLYPVWQLDAGEELLLHRMMFKHFLGTSYDTVGAGISGTRLIKWSRFLGADLASLFCSELVAAVLMRLGRMPVRNPAVYNPATLVRTLRRHGVYQDA